jgi:hypothetical protein
VLGVSVVGGRNLLGHHCFVSFTLHLQCLAMIIVFFLIIIIMEQWFHIEFRGICVCFDVCVWVCACTCERVCEREKHLPAGQVYFICDSIVP